MSSALLLMEVFSVEPRARIRLAEVRLTLFPDFEYGGIFAQYWHYWDWVERSIFIGLALMSCYTPFVLIRFACRYYVARRSFESSSAADRHRHSRQFIKDLSQGLDIVKAISSAALFLALAGTTYQISVAFNAIAVTKSTGLAVVAGGIFSVMMCTGVGILVAISATLAHNLLRRRIELLCSRLNGDHTVAEHRMGSFRRAQSLPLQKRFSGVPPFAVIAVIVWVGILYLFLILQPHATKGLRVVLPAGTCPSDIVNRDVLVHVTEDGKLFLNTEPVAWNELVGRLHAIYGMRRYRELFLHADDGASFQTVADAIDIARSSPVEGPYPPGITVNLITPTAKAERTGCYSLILERIRQRPSKKSK